MTGIQLACVFIGGGLGSMSRFAIGHLYTLKNGFPIGTFIANILACLILGILLGYHLNKPISSEMRLLLLTGFCGGFSTFSTFSSETLKLIQGQQIGWALGYVLLSVVLGVLAVFFGSWVVRSFGILGD